MTLGSCLCKPGFIPVQFKLMQGDELQLKGEGFDLMAWREQGDSVYLGTYTILKGTSHFGWAMY